MAEESKYITKKKPEYITKKKPEYITKKKRPIREKIPYITKKEESSGPYITRKDPVERKARGGRAGYSKGGGVRKIAKGCGAVMRRKKTLYI